MCVDLAVRRIYLAMVLLFFAALAAARLAAAEGPYPPLVLRPERGGLAPLLLVKRPVGLVEYKALDRITLNGVDVRLVPREDLQKLLERGGVEVREEGDTTPIYYSTGKAPYLAVAPLRYNRRLFAGQPEGLRRLSPGLYVAPGQPWLAPPPMGPGSVAEIAVYRYAGHGLVFEALYRLNGSMLGAAAGAAPRPSSTRGALLPYRLVAGLQPPEGWLSDLVPWDSAKPSQGSLGSLLGNGTVHVAGYSWRRSDTFLVPPRSTRYEVWVVIRPRRHVHGVLTVEIDGRTVLSAGLAPDVAVLYAGVVVHTYPEERGNYLDRRPVRVTVALEGIDGEVDALLSTSVYARSYVGRDDPLVEPWSETAYGQAFDYRPTPAERLGIPLPKAGSLTLLLPLEPPLVDDMAGSLSLTIHGFGQTEPHHVRVYVGDLLACDEYTHPAPQRGPDGPLQEATCRVPPAALREEITRYMKLGSALPVKVSVDGVGGSMSWFVEPFRLVVLSRPRYSPPLGAARELATQRPSLYVSSYPADSYGIVLYGLASWAQLSHHPGRGFSAESTWTLSHVAVMLAAERPRAGDDLPFRLVFALYGAGSRRAPSYYGSGILGLADADVVAAEGRLFLRAVDRQGRVLCLSGATLGPSKLIGGGGRDERLRRAVDVVGWVLGAASLVVGGAWSRVAGVAAQLLSVPSLFYTGTPLELQADVVYMGSRGGRCVAAVEVRYTAKPSWTMSGMHGVYMEARLTPPMGGLLPSWPSGARLVVDIEGNVTVINYGDFEGASEDARPAVIHYSRSVTIPGRG